MSTQIIPIPRCELSIRPAALADYPFIDRLQDVHSKALGFMQKAAIEGKINAGHVLIAEDETRIPIGYCISQDRYYKRDDLGVVYQLNVVPMKQRALVGATLIREVFDRAAYGCRLFCCWCAQDLDANYFWQSLGFIPLAFRTGAVGKKTRTHIFWQRRIRAGDVTTAYWYPSKTDGGMMRADRLILPIPPGVHWTDEMPVLLPGRGETCLALAAEGDTSVAPTKPAEGDTSVAPTKPAEGDTSVAPTKTPKPQMPKAQKAPKRGIVPMCGVFFAPPATQAAAKAKPRKTKRAKVKADPKHVAAARELRDRYLEQFNAGLVPAQLPAGKYDVCRALADDAATQVEPMLLEQAA